MPRDALIEVRTGTAAEWTDANPVLALGEPGSESDTGKLKLGDGTAAWVDLPYSGGDVSLPIAETDVSGLTDDLDALGTAVAARIPLSQKGAANGVAGLDAGALLADSIIPPGIARDSEVDAKIAAAVGALINGAPGALDTLKELADAVNDDASFAASVTTALAGKVGTGRTIGTGTGLSGGGDLTADRILAVVYGTTAGTALQGNDPAVTNARTPTAHAASHAAAGSDALTLSKSQIGLGNVDNTSDANKPVSTAQAAAIALKAWALPDSGSVVTSATPPTAVANKTYRIDTTANPIPIPLPTAPPNLTQLVLKLVAPSPVVNPVTFTCGGTDVINRAGGATFGTLVLLGQSAWLQYESGIWTVVVTDTPLAQLDGRFAPIATFSRAVYRFVD